LEYEMREVRGQEDRVLAGSGADLEHVARCGQDPSQRSQ
jgi:hypothetical protein